MPETPFHRSVDDAYRRAEELQRRAAKEGSEEAQAVAEALVGLQVALEELQTAEEELHQRNDELMEVREAEAEARQRYEDLFESAPDAYLVTDLDGAIQEANRAARALLDLPPPLVKGLPLARHVAEEKRGSFRHVVNQLAAGGTRTNWDLALHSRGGEDEILVTASVSGVDDGSGRRIGLRWLLREVTVARRLEAEVLRARHIEAIGTLAGGLAHDFNNYLTALLGDIALVRRRLAPEAEARESLDRAERTALAAADLSKQLLTFARGGAPVTQAVSTRELIEQSVTFMARDSHIRVRFTLPDGLWSAVVDQGQISQVLTNLVRNAQEAMLHGGMIEVGAENVAVDAAHPQLFLDPGDYIRVWVADVGAGIAPEVVHRVFDPYFTTKTDGTGLGLATAQSIVRRHGGHIGFSPNPSGGTTFELYLPATRQVTAREETAPRPAAAGHGSLLVVDDEALLRAVVAAMLQEAGYQVKVARDGPEAVSQYRRAQEAGEPFDAVVMDLVMPGMSGEDATREILSLDPAAKVIASSGYSNTPVMANYRDHGFAGVAPKPYTLEGLDRVLREALRGGDGRTAPAA